MLDIKLIRETPEVVRVGLQSRHSPVDISAVLELDERRRAAITEGDRLKNERNSVSKKIGELKKAGQDTTEIQRQTREIGEQIAALDAQVREREMMATAIENEKNRDNKLMIEKLKLASSLTVHPESEDMVQGLLATETIPLYEQT